LKFPEYITGNVCHDLPTPTTTIMIDKFNFSLRIHDPPGPLKDSEQPPDSDFPSVAHDIDA
jgi:hypothetical protein